MLKNRYFSIFAVAALVGLAACGGNDEGEATTEETPAVDATAPVAEPAPMVTDTMATTAPAAPVDTAAVTTTTTTTTTDTAATHP